MATQYVIIDTFDNSGAASFVFALKDSTTARAAVAVDTITHAFAAGTNNTIIVTLTNATVIPAGDYFLQVTIDGVAGFVWVALAGVADEVVYATDAKGIGTIRTLDALDTAQDTQHVETQDRLGYVLAALAGDCADAGTAAETYTITIGAETFTIDHTGLDATGNRGTAVLTKS